MCSLYLQPSWITEEEFGMGHLDLKPVPSVSSKSLSGNIAPSQNGSGVNLSLNEPAGGRIVSTGQHSDIGNSVKDPVLRTKPVDGRLERTEIASHKSDTGHVKPKGGSLVNGSDFQSSSAAVQSGASRSVDNQKQADEFVNRTLEENIMRVSVKASVESEVSSIIFCHLDVITANSIKYFNKSSLSR